MIFDPTQDITTITLVLILTVLGAIWLENNTRVFAKLGAAALCILIGMLCSNLGIIPGASAVYDFFRGPGVLAGITLFLLTVDLGSIKAAGRPMLKAFLLGAFGSALGGAVMGFFLAGAIGPDAWKLSGQFAATYIGGGVNFAAVGQALGTSAEYFTAGVAADVIVTAIWLIICIALPAYFGSSGSSADVQADNGSSSGGGSNFPNLLTSTKAPITLWDLAVLASTVIGCLWLSGVIASFIPVIPKIIWLTTLALFLAQFSTVQKLSGSLVLGNYLLLLFLATNGAVSVIARIVEIGPAVFYFALGTVLVHGVVIFGVGTALKIDAKVIAIASQANVGGASSAMAIAGARGTPHLILPGIAVGLLGMALGNYVGLLVAHLLKLWGA